MRIVISALFALVALSVLGLIGVAIYARSVPMPAALWHVDPAEVTPPASPNFALRTGAEAPVLDGTPREVAARINEVALAEGATLIGGSVAEGHMTYVQRSRLMGYPDAISIRVHLEPDGVRSRVEVFSRARMGYGDMGVNAARVARWLAAAAN